MANITNLSQLQSAGRGFINMGTSSDMQTASTVVPAVTGKSHYIRSITLSTVVPGLALTIQDNTGTPVKIVGPITLVTSTTSETGGDSSCTINFLEPVKVAAGKSIDIISNQAGAGLVLIQGYTE